MLAAMEREKFITAQDPVWHRVQAELAAGLKESHWMWFVFPQLGALGRSGRARHYGISDLAEARAYLADPVLGPRLRAACGLASASPASTAVELFGNVDALKFRSCLTLFARAAEAESPEQGAPFRAALDRFYAGQEDPLTVALL